MRCGHLSAVTALSLVLLAGGALTACGQKGPLFLPPPETATPPSAVEPGPSTGAERNTAPAATLPTGAAAPAPEAAETPVPAN